MFNFKVKMFFLFILRFVVMLNIVGKLYICKILFFLRKCIIIGRKSENYLILLYIYYSIYNCWFCYICDK